MRWSERSVRALLRHVQTPHRLERDPIGHALGRAWAKSGARDGMLEIVQRALVMSDPRLRELIYRCDFAGESAKQVAADMHLSRRQFFRYRALAVDAIALEVERTLQSAPPAPARRPSSDTILRRWHGRVPREKADEYLALMESVSIPDYRAIRGNIAAYVLRRDELDVTHIETLSIWDSERAVKRYAGDEVLLPKYYDFDGQYLLEFEERVMHYSATYATRIARSAKCR